MTAVLNGSCEASRRTAIDERQTRLVGRPEGPPCDGFVAASPNAHGRRLE